MVGSLTRDRCVPCLCEPILTDGIAWTAIPGLAASAVRGTVWVPFKMLRERIPMLSAMTLDQLGAKMRCDKYGKRPERYYPANQSDTPKGLFEACRAGAEGWEKAAASWRMQRRNCQAVTRKQG